MSKPCLMFSTMKWVCLMNICILHALGTNAEIEALKKVVALAEKKAHGEQALRKKHEARVIEAE